MGALSNNCLSLSFRAAHIFLSLGFEINPFSEA
jgi:hypothetical protein